jgi:hypothetical protein
VSSPSWKQTAVTNASAPRPTNNCAAARGNGPVRVRLIAVVDGPVACTAASLVRRTERAMISDHARSPDRSTGGPQASAPHRLSASCGTEASADGETGTNVPLSTHARWLGEARRQEPVVDLARTKICRGGARGLRPACDQLRVDAAYVLARVFPALRPVLGRAATSLADVQEAHITEVLDPVGILDLGHGVEAKGDRRVRLPSAVRARRELHRKARKRADELFTRLQTAAWRRLALGVTKTAVVYGIGRAGPRHAE